MRAEAVIVAWAEWNDEPGNHTRAVALEEACQAYASTHANAFRRHVTASLRRGLTLPAAIYSWDPT